MADAMRLQEAGQDLIETYHHPRMGASGF